MDILFVNPSSDWKVDQEHKFSARIETGVANQETPHIGIAYLLAAAKKDGLKAGYVDMATDCFSGERLMDLIRQTRPSLVGFSAFTVQIRTAASLASKIKEEFPGVAICVGGPHVIALARRSLEEFPGFDFVVCGEGDHIFTQILSALGDEEALSKINGVVTRKSREVSIKRIEDLDALPFPAWECFDLSKYPGTYPHRTRCELPMVTGRGCPYRCTFCCRSLGSKIRHRGVMSVIDEIERNIRDFDCQSIAFLDETFIIHPAWFEEFLKIFTDRGLHRKLTWSCSTRVDGVNLDLLRRMKDAGCYYIFYGIESADDLTLKKIHKNITVEQIKNAVRWTRETGILPTGAFIFGLPGDTREHVLKAISLAEELDLYSVTFPIAVPFPGTELREMALEGKCGMKVLSDNWDHYGKQDPGVLVSEELSWGQRKELQRLAYQRNPKKKVVDYFKHLADMKREARS